MHNKSLSLLTVATTTLFSLSALQAQTLPDDWAFSADGKRLVIGGKAATGLYDSTTIRSIYLTFPQANYWNLLTTNYTTHTDLLASMVVDGTTYDSIGVRFKGQTSYMMVNGQKKSFNISLDYVRPNQDLMGYQTLNLNNCFQDESFIREVFYLHQIRKHIPAAKANYVHLYINGQDWGLYPNVQQINKDFLKEWYLSNDGANWRCDRPPGSGGGPGGSWGDGTTALNYLGADTALYQTYYTLKSADVVPNPWEILGDVCDVLDNTPSANLPSILPDYMDIDRTLWYLASEVAFSDDDSYIYKGKMDYYAYYEPETGRLVPQEYDGNSVMDPSHASWSAFYNENNANYPLMNKLLAVPQWRQRYLAHLRTIIADEMGTTETTNIINNLKNQIDALVQSDPKKLYTYTQFQSEISVLTNFMSTRRTNLLANSEVAQVAPTIATVDYADANGSTWTPPQDGQVARVTAQVTSSNGIDHVSLYYASDLVGNFTEITMFDDGAHNDGAASDGVYGADIPAFAGGTWVRFYVEAVAGNAAKSASYSPKGAEHDVYVYLVAPAVSAANDVAINELMASNSTTMADAAGDFDDWVELYNKSGQPVDISGWYLTDNLTNLDKWEINANTILPADGYLIIWADEDSAQGVDHANFKLSASGETLWLLNSNLELVDSVSFGTQTTDMGYARVPNGTGNFVAQAPTFNANNETGVSVKTIADAVPTFLVFPNPAQTRFYVKREITAAEDTNLLVTNALGEVIYQNNTNAPLLEITSSDWASGVYFVHTNGAVQKVVVTR